MIDQQIQQSQLKMEQLKATAITEFDDKARVLFDAIPNPVIEAHLKTRHNIDLSKRRSEHDTEDEDPDPEDEDPALFRSLLTIFMEVLQSSEANLEVHMARLMFLQDAHEACDIDALPAGTVTRD